jgi:hypothetical protein
MIVDRFDRSVTDRIAAPQVTQRLIGIPLVNSSNGVNDDSLARFRIQPPSA